MLPAFHTLRAQAEQCTMLSFRDGPKDQARNLEIPDRRFASSGMTGLKKVATLPSTV
jgi:hypothetical protein